MKSKKISKKLKPEFHEELKGFEIKINSFGEMESTFSIDRLNKFLNETSKLEDKKEKEEK
jgi:hypothetical protein